MATHSTPLPTLQDYLEYERHSSNRNEYFSGEIVAMSGWTGRHSELSARLIRLLSEGSCRVFDSNLKIYLKQEEQCVYPDISVVCGVPAYLDVREDVLLNPALMVKVLSSSTKRYDKGNKSLYYRNLSSLRHCLLISQDRVFIEHSIRQHEGTWIVESYRDLDRKIILQELGLELNLESIYTGIVS